VHVLTKIFIVLVALLAVMLVPLVVVYAKNETTYKQRYVAADADRAAAEAASTSAQVNYAAEIAKLQGDVARLSEQLGQKEATLTGKETELAQLESELAGSQMQFSQLGAELKQLVSTNQAGQNLVTQLVAEANELRTQTLQSARENAELVTRVREMDRELAVANAAVRSLREEVQRLSEASDRYLQTIDAYAARFGELETDRGVPTAVIDTKVVANVIDVRANDQGRTLAEIDAGQRDGVKVGWEMTLADAQGTYLGRLRIIEVDVNSAVGIAETASGEAATVSVGAKAYALPD
jgi:predicted nuclease with TOPRIM domain